MGGGSRTVGVVRHHGDVAPAPLRLVLGEEELLVERAVEDVVAEVREIEPGAELSRHRASELTPVDLADVLSPSLFAEGRVVVVTAAQEAGKELATAIVGQAAEPAEGIVFVVTHAGGARNKALADTLRRSGAVVTVCERVKWPNERADFVRSEVRRADGRISRDAVDLVVEAVAADLREIAAAVGQLLADTAGEIDATAVRRYYRGRADVSGWTVADKVVAGDRAGALEELRWAQALGVPSVLIADALADGIRTLARVGSAGRGDPNRLASTLGMPPGKIRRAQAHVRSWHPDAIATAVALTAQLNADVKGASPEPDYALERAVLLLCAARGPR